VRTLLCNLCISNWQCVKLLKVTDVKTLDEWRDRWTDYVVDCGISGLHAVTVETLTEVAGNLLDHFYMYRYDMRFG